VTGPAALSLQNTYFEGHNVVYLWRDGDDVGLVDTGYGAPSVERQLREALAAHELSFADVDDVALTHWHGDHVGLARTIQAESGARVVVHEADAGLAARDPDAVADLRSTQEDCFEAWAMPEDARAELARVHDETLDAAGPTVDAVTDGEEVHIGGAALTVRHTPGHTAGHCAFEFESDRGREVVTGDALLPVYTPNVGGADVRLDDPLTAYLATLDWIASAGFVRGWPGHRGPIVDVAGRASDIREHHATRSRRILDLLEDASLNTWEVSDALFGELSGVHVLHGPGEAHAHLRHLQDGGFLAREGRTYTLLERPPDTFF
jgi:glyoxylase-like metal-dependent hydrolase (beta-lactamase superfamily II)